MGRPAKHTADDFVDAAVSLFAEKGVRAVTLGAVAESLHAANGSIYHRFPDRPSLLAAIWLRTTKEFEAAYRTQLGTATIPSAIAASAWVVEWCRANPQKAQVLQAGMRTFDPDSWTPEARRSASTDADFEAEARKHIAELGDSTAATPAQIAFAMFDLPLAVVRPALQAGRTPSERDVELVRELVGVILRQ